MAKRWNLIRDLSEAIKTQVFSGGACNILDNHGNLLRNTERDDINDWLTEKSLVVFDPQVHPDTHGEEYDYLRHHPMEMAAREHAKVNLYEVSPRTFGGITSFEIAIDQFHPSAPTVIYFSDGRTGQDKIPAHSAKGHPMFVPDGLMSNENAMRAHYREFIKNANHMRKYLVGFARQMQTLTVAFTDNPAKGDIVISPDRMHAVDLFAAVVRAASNERVFVTFLGGKEAKDERGNPIFMAPKEPNEVQLRALLDQYVDEGNALRRAIAELVEINVFVRIVYTQRSAINTLSELLELKELL